jgi:hypothetical protein
MDELNDDLYLVYIHIDPKIEEFIKLYLIEIKEVKKIDEVKEENEVKEIKEIKKIDEVKEENEVKKQKDIKIIKRINIGINNILILNINALNKITTITRRMRVIEYINQKYLYLIQKNKCNTKRMLIDSLIDHCKIYYITYTVKNTTFILTYDKIITFGGLSILENGFYEYKNQKLDLDLTIGDNELGGKIIELNL